MRLIRVLIAFIALIAAAGPAKAGLPPIKTVFIIVLENAQWSWVTASTAPYIVNTLLPQAAHAEQYYNPPGLHPSEPNYLWLEAGSNFGVGYDDALQHIAADHFTSQLRRAGISWKSYNENVDGSSCAYTSWSPATDPFVNFSDVLGDDTYCLAEIRPYTELGGDLRNNNVARYNFITPSLADQGHDPSTVTAADAWLSQQMPMIMASQAFQNGGAIFITWDEGDLYNGLDGPIGMIVLSSYAKKNYSNTIHYTHSSTLRTFQEIFGVSPLLNDAANAIDLGDFFLSAGTGNIMPPGSPHGLRVL